MEVPASDWTEREERSDSGADRGDLPAVLRSCFPATVALLKLTAPKSNLLTVKRLPPGNSFRRKMRNATLWRHGSRLKLSFDYFKKVVLSSFRVAAEQCYDWFRPGTRHAPENRLTAVFRRLLPSASVTVQSFFPRATIPISASRAASAAKNEL